MSPFDYLKLGIGAIVGAALMAAPACTVGKSLERNRAKLEAATNALDRIQDMEQSNADFLALSDRERCRVFMRDSGLPVTECNRR